jgi:predicted nucleic acid-binding protein
MSVPDFLDSNVLVYAYDDGEPQKQQISRELLLRSLGGDFVVSVQVLSEFASTLLHKFSTKVPEGKLLDIMDGLSSIQVVQPDREMVRRAIEAHAKYGVHLYDGMIIAAAERGGCERIWSEDLNAGQSYFGVRVENPFA